jgi:hypothetical protein
MELILVAAQTWNSCSLTRLSHYESQQKWNVFDIVIPSLGSQNWERRSFFLYIASVLVFARFTLRLHHDQAVVLGTGL